MSGPEAVLTATAMLALAAAAAGWAAFFVELYRRRFVETIAIPQPTTESVYAPVVEAEEQVEVAVHNAEKMLLADGIKQIAAQQGHPLSDEEALAEAENIMFRMDEGLVPTSNFGGVS